MRSWSWLMLVDRSFRGCFWLIGVVLVLGCTARSGGGDTTVGAGDASGTDVLDAGDDGAVGDATEAAALRILQNQIPLAGCLIPGNTTDVYRAMGLLDVQVNMGYMLFPLLRYDPPSQLARSLALQSFAVSVDLGDLADPDVPSELVDFSVAVSIEVAQCSVIPSAIWAAPLHGLAISGLVWIQNPNIAIAVNVDDLVAFV